MAVICPIVEQHAEDAAFLWLLRDAAVLAPHYRLSDLSKLDERVDANLDGLRIAGDSGWEIAREQLLGVGQPGEVFAAAVLAYEAGDVGHIEEVLNVAAATPETARGLVSALGWLSSDEASKYLKPLLASDSPQQRRIGIAGAAIHRRNPGRALTDAFASEDAPLKARALRAAGELGLVDLQVSVRANTRAKDPFVRFWAAWSSALLGANAEAVSLLQRCAEAPGPLADRAAQLAVRRLPVHDAKLWFKKLVQELGRLRVAIAVAGALGEPEVAGWLIQQMAIPPLARAAGEAFSMLTGVDLAYDDLEGPQPEGFEAGPTDNPDDANVAMDRDLNLPWPDPDLVRKWWSAHRGNFQKNVRYLLGRPIDADSLRLALKDGRQRQRAAAALELALLHPGRPLFETRAAGFRQIPLLA